MPDGVVHARRCPLADSNGLRMGKIALFMFVFSASWRIGNCAPKVVRVSLRSSTVTVARQDFQPAYVSNQPNGPGCDPICKQATATWTI
jgi:hypothetical protein